MECWTPGALSWKSEVQYPLKFSTKLLFTNHLANCLSFPCLRWLLDFRFVKKPGPRIIIVWPCTLWCIVVAQCGDECMGFPTSSKQCNFLQCDSFFFYHRRINFGNSGTNSTQKVLVRLLLLLLVQILIMAESIIFLLYVGRLWCENEEPWGRKASGPSQVRLVHFMEIDHVLFVCCVSAERTSIQFNDDSIVLIF